MQLNNDGDSVKFTALHAANSIVVRYVIPDAPGGRGGDQRHTTQPLYQRGLPSQKINLDFKICVGLRRIPGLTICLCAGSHAGLTPVHMSDEARAMFADIAPGDTVTLQKDVGTATDTAAYYVIDLIDLEEVAPPLSMPASGYLSITDPPYNAIANDGLDDSTAIQNCVSDAEAQGKGVWIPAGTFECLTGTGIAVSGVTVRGAGMWYSTLHGFFARFNCSGNELTSFTTSPSWGRP